MNDARTAGILGIIMSVVFVASIAYLAFGERLGVKSAGATPTSSCVEQKVSS